MEDSLGGLAYWGLQFNAPFIPGIVLIVLSLVLYFLIKPISRSFGGKSADRLALVLRLLCVAVMAAGALTAIILS